MDFAIEYGPKEPVLYLLKLKEVEATDEIRQKITDRFGADFRKNNIAPYYVSLGDKLGEVNKTLKGLTDNYSINLNKIMAETLQTLTKQLINLRNNQGNLDEIKTKILNATKKLAFSQWDEKLASAYSTFEKQFYKYIPYSYAQEKLLYGNEYATSNLNSSMKNTCLHNRTLLEEQMKMIQANKSFILSNLEKALYYLIMTEYFMNASSKIAIEKEPKLLAYLPEELTANIKPQCEEIILSAKEQEKELPKEDLLKEKTNISKTSAAPSKQKNLQVKSNTKQSVKVELKPGHKTVPKEPNPKIERLKYLVDELALLKQKGQVKLSAFLKLITEIGKEIDLELKKTKKGYAVNQSSNPFSFHTPHEDKGVDKAALADLKKLVEGQIEELSESKLELK